jgi:hypothetical protein
VPKEANLVGYRHGRILVVSKVFPAKSPTLWWYQCSCGRWGRAHARDLKRKTRAAEKSCGCANRELAAKSAATINSVNLIGRKFGRWRVLALEPDIKSGHRRWLCQCDCGTVRQVASGSLLQKRSISCGCYQREIAPELALYMSKDRRSRQNLANRSRPAIANTLRYSRQRDATPPWVSKKELRAVYANCPAGYHVDHVHPLKHPRLCGLHVPWNLQYLEASDNLKKSNRLEV